MRSQQKEVAEFVEENNLEASTAFRLLDVVSEVGEVVKDAVKSADYGSSEEDLEIKEDEIGDVFFSLFTVCNDLDINSEKAFESAIEKYRDRIEEKGDPGSR